MSKAANFLQSKVLDQEECPTSWKPWWSTQKFPNLKTLLFGTADSIDYKTHVIWNWFALWQHYCIRITRGPINRGKIPVQLLKRGQVLHVHVNDLPLIGNSIRDWVRMKSWNKSISLALPPGLLRFSGLRMKIKSPRSSQSSLSGISRSKSLR